MAEPVRTEGLSEKQLRLMELLRKQKQMASAAAPEARTSIPRRRPSDPLVLSFGQKRLWFIEQLQPGNAGYNVPGAVRLRGPLRTAVLQRCLDETGRRHEILRTSFQVVDGEPVPVIAERPGLRLQITDLRAVPAEEREAVAARVIHDEHTLPFDMTRDPLARACLLRLGDEEHVFLLVLHHIICDIWSVGVFFRTMMALYDAFLLDRPVSLPELPIQYSDYAVWQQQLLQGESLASLLAYWRSQVEGAPFVLELPVDHPRPPMQSFLGGRCYMNFGVPRTEALKVLGKGEDASLYMVLLAALHALLYRYTGQESILAGVPMANRNRLELEGMIGLLFNTLVLRGDMNGRTTFRELLRQIRERTLGAFNHHDLPFERLVEDLRIERDMSRNPVFQVLFAFQNVPPSVMAAHQLAISRYEVLETTSREDFELDLRETPDGLAGWFGYDAALYDRSTVARSTIHFQNLLDALVSDPDRPLAGLPLLGAAEAHALLYDGNDTAAVAATAAGEVPLFELFAAQAERAPGATAAAGEGIELTYRELRDRALALACELAGRGIGRGDVVAVLDRRGVDFLTAVLGILAAGGAWLPLDPEHPPLRLAQVLGQSGAPLVLASDELLSAATAAAAALPEGVRPQVAPLAAVLDQTPVDRPLPRTGPSDLVYVIFTSGSTGRPKGAMVQQRGLVNHLLAKVEALGLGAADAIAQTASQCFDISVWQSLAALVSGGRVHIYPNEVAHDPAKLLARMERDGVTVAQAVPSLFRLLVEEAGRGAGRPSLARLRWMVIAGEALPPELCREWAALFPATPLVNAYGPTECTDNVTHHLLTAPPAESAARVPIGRPIRAVRLYVVDPELRPLPLGVAGELCVGGDAVGRGYLNAPERTAGVFVPDPFAAAPGARLYRTGDLVRRLADGAFDFLGRIDHQVKVRGFRIELGEIESVLAEHPEVRQSAVLAQAAGPSERALVAYVVTGLAGEDADRELRAFLQERLPEYMVPAGFVALDALPLTPNGKVDRRALLARGGASFAAREDFVAPRNPVEDSLAGIWAQVLKTERVGVYDNFFQLGGQSLLATQVVSRVREAFGVELPVRALFQQPTIAGMAEGIEIALLRGRGLPDALPMLRIPRDGVLEPSFGQERLWFIDQLRPGLTAYNIFGAVRMRGELHLPTLERSFDELVRRHEVLRTTFAAVDGRPVQVLHPPHGLQIPLVDLRGLPEEIRPAEARRLDNEEPQSPFDLAKGPLIRGLLLRVAAGEHVLAVTAHHIVYDVWSRELLIRELGRLYEAFWHGRPSPLPELEVQYADFAWWQRRWLRGEVYDRQLAYWRKQLAGVTAGSELPGDRPRPPVQSFRGARVLHALPAGTTAELKELGKRQGVTLFMTLLAAFDTFLQVYTGEEDIVVGSPIANRNRAETEALIGFFVNTQVLRTDLSGRPTFRQLLGRVRETALGAYAHQDLAFEQLVNELQASRDPARQPLFQVLFNFLTNYKPIVMELPGLTLSPEPNHSGAVQFDLILSIYEAEGALHFSADYSTDLFERSTIARRIEHYANLLAAAVAGPDRAVADLPFWRPEEERQVLVDWNATETAYPREASLPELFAEVAAAWPDAPALVAPASGPGSSEWTYRRLDEESNRLARHLCALGVGVESRVGISMSRSPELILGTLAILKAGGAYVPLDATYPDERLAFMLADTGVQVVLVSAATRERLAALAPVLPIDEDGWRQEEAGPLAVRVPAASLAYVIFTSGSTGRPKGVAVPHRAIVRLVRETNFVRLGPGDRTGHVANISFDAATYEIWGALLTGAAAVVTPRDVVLTPADFAGWIREQGITSMFLTSALFTRMSKEVPDAFATMSELLVGGEAVDPVAARKVLAGRPPRRLLNGYGPTESTTFAAWHLIRDVPPDATSVPIGRPLANTTLYVLSRSGAPVPVGAPGELCIGGDGLAWGYLNRPELTAGRFVPHPWGEGERLYRTGDLVRQRADGAIDYLGRLDQQVKIRGFRIELEEIEAVLRSHRAVRDAAVVAVEAKRRSAADSEGEAEGETDAGAPTYHKLAAFLVLQPGEPEPQPHALRTFLKESLPEYMVPSGFAIVASLPLTSHGKLDRAALAAAELSRLAPEASYLAPRNPVEESLARIWAELLEVERVGVHDSFFDLGGHSLLTTRLVSRIRDAFQLEVPLQTFFEDPTVAGLAESIELARWASEVAQEPVAAGAAGGGFEEGEL